MAASHQASPQGPPSFLVDELLHVRSEIREQVALLHAKIDAVGRATADSSSRFDAITAVQNAVDKKLEQNTTTTDKLLQTFMRDVDARLDLLEKRVAATKSLQTMNEDLMRLKLSDRDTQSNQSQQHLDHVMECVSINKQNIALVARRLDALTAQISQAQSDMESRIHQTLELAHALSSGQALMEEKHSLETHRVKAQFQHMTQQLNDANEKRAVGVQLVEHGVTSVQNDVTVLQNLHSAMSHEMHDELATLRSHCTSHTTALRRLADEILNLKQDKTEGGRRLHERRNQEPPPPPPPPAQHGDLDLVDELNRLLRHATSHSSPLSSY
ncbi:hypothetical protein LEN26_008099 [Aphanomyces euteiches]|nr:hypothetical protein AeMF1_011154 [Aphanomyces euteiches]KAH9130910.1 hypothetical protein LEN26_008099 [Aphanomyces euteiches]KAH9197185.1 hypothetical protein AeNC1_000835 [Aphanomyces euteiches]